MHTELLFKSPEENGYYMGDIYIDVKLTIYYSTSYTMVSVIQSNDKKSSVPLLTCLPTAKAYNKHALKGI
jgi:hypothetical protein